MRNLLFIVILLVEVLGVAKLAHSASFNDSVLIGGSGPADSKAQLEVKSTAKGILFPRMTNTQRDAITSPPTSLIIFSTTDDVFEFWDGAQWTAIGAGAGNITGPASSTNNAIVLWNGTDATSIKDSSITVSGSAITGSLTGNASTATALASNPTDCASDRYATTIDASGNLTCAQVNAAAGVTGTLPLANGGTGQTSKSAAFDALAPCTSGGGGLITYGSGTNSCLTTAIGDLGKPLVSAGALGPDTYSTLGISGGGTNNASLGVTAGGVIYSDGSKLANVGAGTTGQVLQSNGSSAPTWGTATSAPITNFLVNSAFDYWQAGTSATVTATGGGTPTAAYLYQADQWYVKNILGGGTAEGVITYSQTTGVTDGSRYGAKVQITTAPTGTGIQNGMELYQPLSNRASIALYNQTASFSILVKSFGNVNQIGCQFYYATSEGKLSSSIGSEQTATVNTSTFSSCTISGQALGTSQTTSGIIGVRIRPTAVSTGHLYDLNNGFVVEQAMLNLGASVGTFARQFNDAAAEIASAQYFYEKSYDLTTALGTITYNGDHHFSCAGANGFTSTRFMVIKRVAPTVTIYSPTTGATSKCADVTTSSDVSCTAANVGSGEFTYVPTCLASAQMGAQWAADARM